MFDSRYDFFFSFNEAFSVNLCKPNSIIPTQQVKCFDKHPPTSYEDLRSILYPTIQVDINVLMSRRVRGSLSDLIPLQQSHVNRQLFDLEVKRRYQNSHVSTAYTWNFNGNSCTYHLHHIA